jgi:hypothetical protein
MIRIDLGAEIDGPGPRAGKRHGIFGALPRANPHPEPDEHQGAGDKQQVEREPVESAFLSSSRHGASSSLRSLRRKNEGGCECNHKTGQFTPS